MLAKWLASPQNPWFATSFANRVWAHFLGTGIVEPVDDVRVSNPAVEPRAARRAGQAVHRLPSTTSRRWCATSATRGPTSGRPQRNESNASDDRNFAHATGPADQGREPARHHQQVTDTKDKFQGLPLGARAVQIADGRSSTYFLTTFGRATRETVCSCEVKMEPTLSQALHLLNGDTVNTQDPAGRRDQEADGRRRSSPRNGSSTSTSAASPASRRQEELTILTAIARPRDQDQQTQALERPLLGPAQ